MTKSSLREVFAQWQPVIKFAPFLLRNGINGSSFSRFMKGQMFDFEISLNKLQALYQDIYVTIQNLT